MTLYSHSLLTPFLSLVLLGVLSCSPVLIVDGVYDVATIVAYQPDPEPWRRGKNNYEPIILASNKEMIRIKYLSIGPNAEHEQVKQLMSEHCHGAYLETSRVELRGYDTVEAECTHDTVL